MTWAAQYIGQPWVNGSHDCWAFFRRVQREQFGREVPAVNIDALNLRAILTEFKNHDEYENWDEVATPVDGDAVLMSSSRLTSHIGVWLDGCVLHCVRGSGVVFTKPNQLASMGYKVTGYYRGR